MDKITLEEYAFLSELAYDVTRNRENKFKIKDLGDSWEEVEYTEHGSNDTEFSAGVYKKGNEVVIAFTGTNDEHEYPNMNIPAGLGWVTEQVKDALVLAIKIINQYKDDPQINITFTGHSLGGGLASIMATFFDKKATVFDEAPFEKSVTNTQAVFRYALFLKNNDQVGELPTELIEYFNSSSIGDLWQNINTEWDVRFAVGMAKAYESLKDDPQNKDNPHYKEMYKYYSEISNLLKNAKGFDEFLSRESNVTNHYLPGEILEYFRLAIPAICGDGQDYVVDVGSQINLNPLENLDITIKLHLMPLLNAVIWSDDFKAAVKKHQYAAGTFYDDQLYGYDYNIDKNNTNAKYDANFLVQAVRTHVQEKNDWLGAIAKDLNKIIDSDAMQDDSLSKGLLAALTEYWYFNDNPAKSAFIQLNGGVQVDFSQFSEKADGKGFSKFTGSLASHFTFSSISHQLVKSGHGSAIYTNAKDLGARFKTYSISYYGQESFSTGTSNLSKENTYILGVGSKNVTAQGGSGHDMIFGGSSYDNIDGGAGNDIIFSNATTGAYLKGGDGDDIIWSFEKSKIEGGANDDVIYSYGDKSTIDAGADDDVIYSYGNNTTIEGGSGIDVIYAYGDDAVIKGGDGVDFLIGYGKNSVFEGGDGEDIYYVSKKGGRIKDSDGKGIVNFNDRRLTACIRFVGFDNKFYDFSGNVYVVEGTTLVVNNSLYIENFLSKGASLDSLGKSYTKLGITLLFLRFKYEVRHILTI